MSSKSAAIDWKILAQLFGGGALVGGGVGAVTSYARHMDALKHELQAQNDSAHDDDVLYVDVKQRPPAGTKKASDDSASGSTFALGSLAALLGAVGAYKGVRNQYNAARRKELQQQLDEAQKVYVDTLTNSKVANFPALAVGSGTVGLATLLGMIGTAVVANRALSKQFPEIKHPDRDKPKRVVIRSAEDPKPEEENKPEAADQSLSTSPDAREAMLGAVLPYQTKSSAFHWDDVVEAAAQGRTQEIFNLCKDGFGDSVFDLCRGASQVKSSSINRQMAISWLAHEPLVSATLEPYMGAAVCELGGTNLLKLAGCYPPAAQEHFYKLAELTAVISRNKAGVPLPMTKDAFVPDELLAARALQNLLQDNQPEKRQKDELEPLHGVSSMQGKSTESGEKLDGLPLMETEGATAKEFLRKYKPALDAALA